MKEIVLEGLNCAHCAKKIEDELKSLTCISDVEFNFVTKKLRFNLNEATTYNQAIDVISKVSTNIKDGVKIIDSEVQHPINKKINFELLKLIIGYVAYILAFSELINDWFFILIYLIIGSAYNTHCQVKIISYIVL